MTAEPGLRARKKQATRKRISDVATSLFAERGFDNVTVAEVAEAANVAKMTVFNYFPRKEELFLDRGGDAEQLIGAALRDRPPGRSVVATLHQLLLDLIAAGHPFDAVGNFWQVVVDSATLRNALRQAADRHERILTTLLGQHVEPRPGDPPAELVAALVVALYRTVHRHAIRAALSGLGADEIRPQLIELVDKGFGLLDTALGDYGTR